MISEARRHRRSHLEGLVDPAEVVVHEMQGQGVFEVLDLLREGVGQSGEPAHLHPHREVLPLGVTGRDVPEVGIALDRRRPRPDASG